MTSLTLDHQIHDWVNTALNETDLKVVLLAGDASARKYYRIQTVDKSYILMSWLPFKSIDYPFISVQKQFKSCHVQVPEIIDVSESLGLMLLQDLGDITLEAEYIKATEENVKINLYKKTLEQLILIHDQVTSSPIQSVANHLAFDTEKLLWEMNYCRDHLLFGLLKIKLTDADQNQLQKVFTDFCSKLDQEKTVICHRDFHSRNIMLDQKQVYIIDFQDARIGTRQYDLVSLLKDSYVNIDENFESTMLNYYLENSKAKSTHHYSLEKFMYIYQLQALQRCFKACGSFASFMNMRQDRRYLKYLSPTLKKVSKTLEYFPQYSFLSNLLKNSSAENLDYEKL